MGTQSVNTKVGGTKKKLEFFMKIHRPKQSNKRSLIQCISNRHGGKQHGNATYGKRSKNRVKEQRERIEEFANQLHSHSQMKNFTKGFADLALLTANVNQLRHVLELQDDTMRTLNIVFLSLSIFLQVICGALLVLDHTLDLKSEKGLKQCR